MVNIVQLELLQKAIKNLSMDVLKLELNYLLAKGFGLLFGCWVQIYQK